VGGCCHVAVEPGRPPRRTARSHRRAHRRRRASRRGSPSRRRRPRRRPRRRGSEAKIPCSSAVAVSCVPALRVSNTLTPPPVSSLQADHRARPLAAAPTRPRRRAASAREEELPFPASVRTWAPSRSPRPCTSGRRAGGRPTRTGAAPGDEGARGEAAFVIPCVCRRPRASVVTSRSQVLADGRRRVYANAGRPAASSVSPAGPSDEPLRRPGDDAQLPAAAREREPGAVLGLDQHARPATSVDDEPREHLSRAWHPADARRTSSRGGRRATTTSRPEHERHARRSVGRDREQRLARGRRARSRPEPAGEGKERERRSRPSRHLT
jgi:hypothetical protein